jgi:urease accessory protein UreH
VIKTSLCDWTENDVLAFERSSPGVFTEVELKKTSSLVLTEGVKPRGVCACAMAQPANAATANDEVEIYMMKLAMFV